MKTVEYTEYYVYHRTYSIQVEDSVVENEDNLEGYIQDNYNLDDYLIYESDSYLEEVDVDVK